MAHADTTILDAFVARLVSMTSVADADVHKEHIWDFTDDALPAMDVTLIGSSRMDEDEGDGTLGGMITMQAAVVVDHYAKANDDVGDQLRAMASETVSKIISSATDTDLGGLVSELDYVGYELELSGEEEKPVGHLQQTFSIVYRVLVHDPETIQS